MRTLETKGIVYQGMIEKELIKRIKMRGLKKKRREEREILSHEINVEVEYHEIDVQVHENDEEMRNVEDIFNENIDIDLTSESIVSSI